MGIQTSFRVSTSYRELVNHVEQIPTTLSTVVIEENLEFMEKLGQPGAIVPLLQEVMDDEVTLKEIASRSYMHVDHFHKIVFVGSDAINGYRLTLHMWIPPYAEDHVYGEAIHNHRFSFWSHILAGELVSEKYDRSTSGPLFREYRYTPTQRGTAFSDFYEFVGEQSLTCSAPSAKHSGQAYFMAANNIHRVLPPTETMTCTLVLRGPRERSSSNVFNTAYPSNDTNVDNVMFDPAYVRTRLEGLVRVLMTNHR